MDSSAKAKRNQDAYEPYRHLNDSESTLRPTSHRPREYVPRKRRNSGGLNAFRVVLRLLSTAVALAVVGVLASAIATSNSNQAMRMLWPHGMALKAWPSDGFKTAPIYLMLGAASLAAFVNAIGLMTHLLPLNKKAPTRFRVAVTIVSHLVVAAACVIASIMSRLQHNSVFNWSCNTKQYELTMDKNEVGLRQMCIESVSTFAAEILIAGTEACNLVVFIILVRSGKKNRVLKEWVPYQSTEYRKLDDGTSGEDIAMLEKSRASMA